MTLGGPLQAGETNGYQTTKSQSIGVVGSVVSAELKTLRSDLRSPRSADLLGGLRVAKALIRFRQTQILERGSRTERPPSKPETSPQAVVFPVEYFAGLTPRHQRSIHLIKISDAGHCFFAARLYGSFIPCPQFLYGRSASFPTSGVNSNGNRLT